MAHYETLGVSKTATTEDIKKSYHRLSKQHHPDRPGGDTEQFKKVQEAYEILSDPEKKTQYDNPRPRFSGHSFSFGSGATQFFFNMGGGGGGFFRPQPIRKLDLEMHLQVTLQEIYSGVSKKFKVKRHRVQENQEQEKLVLDEKVLEIDIKPGIRNGETIVIQGEGNQYPGVPRVGNIILRIQEVNRTLFQRRGMHLYYPLKISLKHALCGFQTKIEHLDGSEVAVKIEDQIIHPGMNHRIANQGLRFFKKSATKTDEEEIRGDLIVHFDVEFPKELSKEAKRQIFSALDDAV